MRINGRLLLFLLFVGLAGAAYAQDVNDDLKPKPKKKVAKKVAKKVVKTSSKKKRTKTVRRAAPKKVKKKVVRSKPRKKSKPKKQVIARKRQVPQNVKPAETSEQIFERYVDYQQSLSVTPEDWNRVVALSNAKLKEFKSDAKAKAQLSFAMGQLARSRRDFPGALLHFSASANSLSNSALPYYGLGMTYLEIKKPGEAEDSFKKAIALKNDFALAYKGLGLVMQAKGKEKKAKKYFEQAGKMGFKEANANPAPTPTP